MTRVPDLPLSPTVLEKALAAELEKALSEQGVRGQVLEHLREAGETGITLQELRDLGFGGSVGIHVESLRFEGHGISSEWEAVADSTTRPYTLRWVLTHDAWADEPSGSPENGDQGPEEADVAAAPGAVPAQAARPAEAPANDA